MRLTASGAEHHMAHFWEMAVINEEIIAMLEKVHGVKSLEDPDVVVLGFDTTLTYEKLSKACHYIIIVGDRLYTDIAVADHRDVIMKFKKNISIFHIFYYISS